MKIVLALVEQIGGELHILAGDNGRGTRFAVTFVRSLARGSVQPNRSWGVVGRAPLRAFQRPPNRQSVSLGSRHSLVRGRGARAGVPNPKFARLCSRRLRELRVQRDTTIIMLLVSPWFGSSLRSNLRFWANFRTATLEHTGHANGWS